eukprot:Filipodium_phascolosomae@DN2086_c0_g1_i1.p2
MQAMVNLAYQESQWRPAGTEGGAPEMLAECGLGHFIKIDKGRLDLRRALGGDLRSRRKVVSKVIGRHCWRPDSARQRAAPVDKINKDMAVAVIFFPSNLRKSPPKEGLLGRLCVEVGKNDT